MSDIAVALAGDRFASALYDAVLDGGDFARALDELRTATHSLECNLVLADGSASGIRFVGARGYFTPALQEAYARDFFDIDPKKKIFARRQPGYVFNDVHHFDDGFVARDPFYQEFSLPLDSRHTLDLMFSRTPGRERYLALMRTERAGPFEAGLERLLLDAARHVDRALRLRERIEAVQSALDLARAALDGLRFGVVVFDERGRAAFANAAARTLAAEGSMLQLRQGQVFLRQAAPEHALRAAVEGLARGRDRSPSILRLADDEGRSWVLAAIPLPAAGLDLGVGRGAMLMIVDTSGAAEMRAADLMSLYGLTRAEAELAVGLGAGETLRSYALRRGVKPSTVRSQLLAILQKTSLHRQADLVRLVAALPRLAD